MGSSMMKWVLGWTNGADVFCKGANRSGRGLDRRADFERTVGDQNGVFDHRHSPSIFENTLAASVPSLLLEDQA